MSMNDDYGQHHDQWDEAPSSGTPSRYRDEVFSRRVPAGRRTYFFDVKATRSGEDFFIVITESKRVGDQRHEKHKIFVYKEDFAKFIKGLYEAMEDVRTERLPDYEFYGFPSVEFPEREED